MKIAMLREISPNISECEITNISRKPIDFVIAEEQHKKYADALNDLGYSIHMIDTDIDMPDSVFIEDTAVVLDEIAVITNPGVHSRKGEIKEVANALNTYKDLKYIDSTGTLDGGDVLRIGKILYVGKSCRSSAVGISLLREIVAPHGFEVMSIPVQGCLHLKTAVTQVAENKILINPSWVSPDFFGDMDYITVHPSESYGANALFLEDGVLYPSAFPNTRKTLLDEGINVVAVDMSELAKAEGGVTCCSLIFDF